MSEEAVLVYLPLVDDGLPLDEIEDALTHAVEQAGVGEFDDSDLGPDIAVLHTYGTDADALFDVVETALDGFTLPIGSHAVKRYGPPGALAERVELG